MLLKLLGQIFSKASCSQEEQDRNVYPDQPQLVKTNRLLEIDKRLYWKIEPNVVLKLTPKNRIERHLPQRNLPKDNCPKNLLLNLFCSTDNCPMVFCPKHYSLREKTAFILWWVFLLHLQRRSGVTCVFKPKIYWALFLSQILLDFFRCWKW